MPRERVNQSLPNQKQTGIFCMQAWANIKQRRTKTYVSFQDERPRGLNLSLDVVPFVCMWIVHREKKPKTDMWNQMFVSCRILLSHLTRTSSPHKAFKSYEKLTLLLRNVSEKRKDQGVVQAISLPMQED